MYPLSLALQYPYKHWGSFGGVATPIYPIWESLTLILNATRRKKYYPYYVHGYTWLWFAKDKQKNKTKIEKNK